MNKLTSVVKIAPFLFAIFIVTCATELAGNQAPNVLWIISDDLGPELSCYGYIGVKTPHIDQLAANGRLYTKAFSTAPVCSSSRSAFQTGRYQTSIRCHHHLTRNKQSLPDSVPTAIELMRKKGYFISLGSGIAGDKSNVKFGVNYLYDKKTIFDGHDWSERKNGQPFFAQVHISEPHRKFKKNTLSRPTATIPPYYPEHPITRADWANYLTSIEELDRKLGSIMKRLKDEKVLGNTLIFFFGDHGRPHVRDKQWLYDGGLHTPLIVSWHNKIEAGSIKNELVSLLDIMPTTLSAANIPLPKLPGSDLLAHDWKGHDVLFAARDRCGDAPDRIRSVRTSRLKYIRNFEPHRPYLQHSGYKKLSYPVLTLMKVMHAEGNWDSLFMSKKRPSEELYDLSIDPHEMTNLAGNPKYENQLLNLRNTLNNWTKETGDQGLMDESETVDINSILKEKRAFYESAMRRRGLDPNLSDRTYLDWWLKELTSN